MKNIYVLSLALIAMALASCSVEKRVHRNGYHVEWWGSKQKIEKANANTEMAVVEEPIEISTPEIAVAEVVETPAVEAKETISPIVNQEVKAEVAQAPKARVTKREIRRAASEFKASNSINYQNTGAINFGDKSSSEPSRGLLIFLCFFIPTLAVYLYEGDFTNRVIVNLILTLLCGIPGVIHALIIIIGEK
jgi:uncharacterized membrane protein YqaE (UPF0057 family)